MPKLFRKVIHISAEDSPNVRLAKAELKLGKKPSHRTVIPGVLSYATYLQRRKFLDKVNAVRRLEGRFYEGEESLMYPPDWIDEAERRFDWLKETLQSEPAVAMGVDGGEGRDKTCWSVVNRLGLKFQFALPTPNTMEIAGRTIEYIKRYRLDPRMVAFDAGGGGKQIADRLREQGYPVRIVFFGAAPTPKDPRAKRAKGREAKKEADEFRQTYKNRRAEMYGILRDLLNPLFVKELDEAGNERVHSMSEFANSPRFALPKDNHELRQELAIMPLLYDSEGKMYLPPKDKPSPTFTGMTIKQLLGHSPDRADSLVLATYAMYKVERTIELQAY